MNGRASARGGAGTVALTLALIAAAAVGLGAAWWLAQPDRSLTQYERLSHEIGCTCGTCPHRPIATCGCPYADGMLDELAAAIGEGGSDEAIVTTFAARYGAEVRLMPTSSGFDLAAWAAPLLMLAVGAVGLIAVLLRWSRMEVAAEPGDTSTAEPEVPDAESARLRARVERELGQDS